MLPWHKKTHTLGGGKYSQNSIGFKFGLAKRKKDRRVQSLWLNLLIEYAY